MVVCWTRGAVLRGSLQCGVATVRGRAPLDNVAAEANVREYHYATVAQYWPAERAHVGNACRDLPFPVARVGAPALHMVSHWGLSEVAAGYLRSWSATTRYTAAHGIDPVDEVERRLREVWVDPDSASALTGR